MCAHALVTAVRTRADLGFHVKSNGAQFWTLRTGQMKRGRPTRGPCGLQERGRGAGASPTETSTGPREKDTGQEQ